MDFMSRGGQARSNSAQASTPVAPAASTNTGSSRPSAPAPEEKKHSYNKLTRIGFLILLFAGTILAVASLIFLAFGKGTYGESELVDKNKLQAVFINVNGTNGGQVYFGNIQDLTPSYIRLRNVFYIQNQQSTDQKDAAASYNLVKLGCELHGPTDEMIINRSEVFFWENLKEDSQVAQKVAEFRKQNPNGQQKCNASDAQSTNQQSGNTQQSSTPTTGGSAQPTTNKPATTPTPTPATPTPTPATRP